MQQAGGRSQLQGDLITNEGGIVGEVEVDGVSYRIQRASGNAREVIRCSDGRSVGRLRGSPSSMWLLEATAIDNELLRSIVRSAIQDGLLVDLPTD
jgi:hypothetical protein